nr:MAG TPA: hypothetical protein [Caudoviricetes sp.]
MDYNTLINPISIFSDIIKERLRTLNKTHSIKIIILYYLSDEKDFWLLRDIAR